MLISRHMINVKNVRWGGKALLMVECQLIKAEGMMEAEGMLQVATTIVIPDPGKSNQ